MDRKPTFVKDVTITVEGARHDGTYYVQGKTVYVQSPLGNKATQVGGSPPEMIAKMLLTELVRSR